MEPLVMPSVREESQVLGGAESLTCCVSPILCPPRRSEEHTSELQSQSNLVCRLLLEKKKNESYGREVLTVRTHGVEQIGNTDHPQFPRHVGVVSYVDAGDHVGIRRNIADPAKAFGL